MTSHSNTWNFSFFASLEPTIYPLVVLHLVIIQ